MIKRLLLIIMVILLCLPGVLAEIEYVPVSFEVSIDFQGERDFRLIMPNGFERHFWWDENESHSDVTFTHTIYEEVDLNTICGDATEVGRYRNISVGLMDMLKICGDFAKETNSSKTYLKQLGQAEKEWDHYETAWENCKDDIDTFENSSVSCENDLGECENKEEICGNSLRDARDDSKELTKVKKEKENLEKSKNNLAIFTAIIVAGICYGIWGRKNKTASSEQQEINSESDAVRDPTNYP